MRPVVAVTVIALAAALVAATFAAVHGAPEQTLAERGRYIVTT